MSKLLSKGVAGEVTVQSESKALRNLPFRFELCAISANFELMIKNKIKKGEERL